MKREDIEKKMSEELVKQVAIQHQIDGLRKMHDAAVLFGNQELAQQHRDHIHASVDAQLDAAASVMLLSRQLAALKP
jgi:hypothetical protein